MVDKTKVSIFLSLVSAVSVRQQQTWCQATKPHPTCARCKRPRESASFLWYAGAEVWVNFSFAQRRSFFRACVVLTSCQMPLGTFAFLELILFYIFSSPFFYPLLCMTDMNEKANTSHRSLTLIFSTIVTWKIWKLFCRNKILKFPFRWSI